MSKLHLLWVYKCVVCLCMSLTVAIKNQRNQQQRKIKDWQCSRMQRVKAGMVLAKSEYLNATDDVEKEFPTLETPDVFRFANQDGT